MLQERFNTLLTGEFPFEGNVLLLLNDRDILSYTLSCSVLIGRNRNAFCVVRPPGHHAGVKGLLSGGESCGFCIFNSVAS